MLENTPVYVIIICSTEQEAENIAEIAIQRRYAAAAHYEHIHSIYRWNGETTEPEKGEWRLTLTTASSRYDDICRILPIWHSYLTPAVSMIQIDATTALVQQWIVENTTAPEESRTDDA